MDLATAISYETAGTFDPWKAGPTTKWGQHRGLIQWGEPQRQKYGVTEDMPIPAQLEAAGRYLVDAGVKPGMGLMDIYSAINAGGVGLYNRSDPAAGGAPGTVADKVNNQMAGHRKKAEALMAAIQQQAAPQVAQAMPPQGILSTPATGQNQNQGLLAQAPAQAPAQGGGLLDYVPSGGGQMPEPMAPLKHLQVPIPPTLYQQAKRKAPSGAFSFRGTRA